MLNGENKCATDYLKICRSKEQKYSVAAYSKAAVFMRHLNSCAWAISKEDCKKLKDQALSGDIRGAEREMNLLVNQRYK